MKKLITFICISNNERQLNEMLLSSIKRLDPLFMEHNLSYSLIRVNNRDNTFRSAAEAYNNAVNNNIDKLGDILIFLHQDIAFDTDNFLIRLVKEIDNNNNQIIGFAGADNKGHVLSNLKYHIDKSFITEYQIDKKEEVLSLDECCFAVPKELFIKLYFDENTCNNWHLYGVDLCYCAREQFGTIISVLPEVIYHKERKGGLSVDDHYLDTLWKLTIKHRPFFDRIYTSCYNIKTNPILASLDIFKYRLRIVARRFLKSK